MELRPREIPERYRELVDRAADFIGRHQLPSGAIPYNEGGIIDPWDYVECAIALDLCGRFDRAASAYLWLREKQNPDGSWYYTYQGEQPQILAKDTNHSSYIATGIWHHYLATQEVGFLREMWPMVEGGIRFALELQQPTGDIYWALDADDKAWPGGLLSASSCIWGSLINGLKIARVVGFDRPEWHKASMRLAEAIRQRPHLFDRFGENIRGYAMHWYYPVLSGVLQGKEGRERILQRWSDFVVPGWGCKCSLDQPWVTVAETCELILALRNIGEWERAEMLLEWIMQLKDKDGGFWMGIRVPEQIIWPPDEKTTWTAAAVILAVVALAEVEGRASINF